MSETSGIEIKTATPDRLDDVADLFDSNGTTRECWCMFHISSHAEFQAGYGAGNRTAFEALAATEDAPLGLLAYQDGVPVGWCAAGPRSRYRRVIGPRTQVLAQRDTSEDDDVWLAPCFFTRVGRRRQGVTRELLNAAVELAGEHGAIAVEGFPRKAGVPPSVEDYLGREEVFEFCGFECIASPTPRRVVMRRNL